MDLGLWLHNGNFGLARFFSRLLALQIKARQVELPNAGLRTVVTAGVRPSTPPPPP